MKDFVDLFSTFPNQSGTLGYLRIVFSNVSIFGNVSKMATNIHFLEMLPKMVIFGIGGTGVVFKVRVMVVGLCPYGSPG